MTDVCDYWDICKYGMSMDKCARPECKKRNDLVDLFERKEKKK